MSEGSMYASRDRCLREHILLSLLLRILGVWAPLCPPSDHRTWIVWEFSIPIAANPAVAIRGKSKGPLSAARHTPGEKDQNPAEEQEYFYKHPFSKSRIASHSRTLVLLTTQRQKASLGPVYSGRHPIRSSWDAGVSPVMGSHQS